MHGLGMALKVTLISNKTAVAIVLCHNNTVRLNEYILVNVC